MSDLSLPGLQQFVGHNVMIIDDERRFTIGGKVTSIESDDDESIKIFYDALVEEVMTSCHYGFQTTEFHNGTPDSFTSEAIQVTITFTPP